MRKYATTYLLGFTFPIGEIHTFWERASQEPVSWILTKYTPMPIQWNVKYVGDQVNFILIAVAMHLYGKTPNGVNKASVLAYICYAVIDTLMYFYDYKTFNYYIVYFIIAVIWLILWKKFKALR